MDIFHTLGNWLDHNRFKSAALILVLSLLFYGLGCESQTASLNDPGLEINRAVYAAEASRFAAETQSERAALMAEVEGFNVMAEALEARLAAGFEDLDRQEQIKTELFDLASGVVSEVAVGTVTPSGIIGTAITALAIVGGFGSLADARRKDKIIANLKNGGGPDPPLE